MSTMTF